MPLKGGEGMSADAPKPWASSEGAELSPAPRYSSACGGGAPSRASHISQAAAPTRLTWPQAAHLGLVMRILLRSEIATEGSRRSLGSGRGRGLARRADNIQRREVPCQ